MSQQSTNTNKPTTQNNCENKTYIYIKDISQQTHTHKTNKHKQQTNQNKSNKHKQNKNKHNNIKTAITKKQTQTTHTQ